MNGLPLTLAAFLLVLAVLVVVHELGHYLVARWCGVKILRFAVGFGKPLWVRRFGHDRTELAICVFPLGGYVKMLDEREGEVAPQELERAYNRQSVGKRSAIVAAGPLANFALAIVIYWTVFVGGTSELLPLLGTPVPGSAAALAGVGNGELVRKIDGETVETWQDLRWILLKKAAAQDSTELEVENESGYVALRRLSLTAIAAEGWEGDGLERLGLGFYRPHLPAVIGKVVAGGAGEQAGLRIGDRVLAVNDVRVDSWLDVVTKVRSSPEQRLLLRILREDRELLIEVNPQVVEEKGKKQGRLGIAVADLGGSQRELSKIVRYDFWSAGRKAIQETWDKSAFSLVMLGKMLIGEVSWRNLSGPVAIADYAGQTARLGMDYYLKFMALLSVSLGVLNLLPVPVLDGGHLLYHVAEVIRRAPLPERVMEIGQQIGMFLLLTLMAFAFFNDINRLFFG